MKGEYALRISPEVRVSVVREINGCVQYVGDDGIPLWGTVDGFHIEFVSVATLAVVEEVRTVMGWGEE